MAPMSHDTELAMGTLAVNPSMSHDTVLALGTLAVNGHHVS